MNTRPRNADTLPEWTNAGVELHPRGQLAEVFAKPPTRQQIKRLEAAMIREGSALPPMEEVLEHHFLPGAYVRKLTIPAGAVIVGKLHKTVHACIIAKGHILCADESGHKDLYAGDVYISPPDIKRVLYALEETVFINVMTNANDEQDIASLEAKLIEPEALEYTKVEVLT